MYHTFNQALHSLRNPHFSGRSTDLKKRRKEEDVAERTAFDSEIRIHLAHLDLPADSVSITLPWLQDGVTSVLFAGSHISNLLPQVNCSEKEKALLESNLEETVSLLDVVNCLKEALNDVQHYVMLVRYAVRSGASMKDIPDEELKPKLLHLHGAISKSMEFMHTRMEENGRHHEGRSKLETCSSLLRRIGEPQPEVSPGSKRAASQAMFSEMYAVKVLTIFICSVFSFALSVKPRRPLSCVPMAEQPSWLDFLQKVQRDVKKLTDEGIEHGKIAFLKELDDLRVHTHDLHDMLDNFLKQEEPNAAIIKANLSHECESLVKESDDLQQGLLAVQQHMDRLFRMLVTIRVDFLDTLCHS